MKLTASEVFVIINALTARNQWLRDEDDVHNELPHGESAIKKLESLGFELNGSPNL